MVIRGVYLESDDDLAVFGMEGQRLVLRLGLSFGSSHDLLSYPVD